MARANENPYHVVLAIDNRAGRRGNILQSTFCSTRSVAERIKEADERSGEFWWADYEIKPVQRPLRTSELAFMILG